MTALRQKMIEDMQLRGLSTSTQANYVRAVRQLAEYYGKSPDRISEEELRQYFLYLSQVKKVSPSTFQIALSAIKFFFEYTLQRQWATLELVRPVREQKLPVVLSVWSSHHHPVWLFPDSRWEGSSSAAPAGPIHNGGVQRAFKSALQKSGIRKPATVHTLGHSWAAHLLEVGMSLRLIQAYLGHATPITTMIYTHLTPQAEAPAVAAINTVVGRLWG